MAGILSHTSNNLEMAGIVLKDIKEISEPIVKIGKTVGIAGMTIGGLIL